MQTSRRPFWEIASHPEGMPEVAGVSEAQPLESSQKKNRVPEGRQTRGLVNRRGLAPLRSLSGKYHIAHTGEQFGVRRPVAALSYLLQNLSENRASQLQYSSR